MRLAVKENMFFREGRGICVTHVMTLVGFLLEATCACGEEKPVVTKPLIYSADRTRLVLRRLRMMRSGRKSRS